MYSFKESQNVNLTLVSPRLTSYQTTPHTIYHPQSCSKHTHVVTVVVSDYCDFVLNLKR